MAAMKWYAGRGGFSYSPNGHHFVRVEDGTEIEVHPDTYDKQFHAYLECIGVQRTSDHEIMQKAEGEWQAYCRIMDAFAEDTQQWLDYQGRGVYITRPRIQAQQKDQQ